VGGGGGGMGFGVAVDKVIGAMEGMAETAPVMRERVAKGLTRKHTPLS